MIFQYVDFWQVIADVIGTIIEVLKPVISPIGAWMVDWIEVALRFFPADSLTVYIALFIVLIVAGALVNALWPGDSPPQFLVRKEKLGDVSEKKIEKVSDEIKLLDLEEEELADRD
jgi:hypothetical protein